MPEVKNRRPIYMSWKALMNSDLNPQQEDGFWQAKGQFPSQNRSPAESDAAGTMWTMYVIASMDDLDEPNKERFSKALDWLRQQREGESNEWFVARLLVAHQLGDGSAVKTMTKKLVSEQHADGGWSWLQEDVSNAYSTGQTLYALASAGLAADSGVVGKGVDFLLNTQREDGSWFVDSELTSDRSSASKDYVYTYWGSAWAVIGLAHSLPGSSSASLQDAASDRSYPN